MAKTKVENTNWYPPWAPRIWAGMRARDYFSLLAENRFRIHPTRYPMTLLVSACSVMNSGLAALQRMAKNRAIGNTLIERPPIFIIGHWRSGTTLTHELMALDKNLAFPNNFDAFVPHHFLVSSLLIQPILKWLLPQKRPMDNMSVQVDSPQEDDFAIMALGAPTQYRRMAFPDNGNDYYKLLDGGALDDAQLNSLESAMRYFLQALTLRYQKQLVLKSPPHTGRIKLLTEWFPTAKFVHLSRHPHELVSSTMRLWKVTDEVQAFQKPRYSDDDLLNYIAKCQQTMYRAYYQDRGLLADNQLVEISFEQLTSQPAETMLQIYQTLELEGADQAVAATLDYFEQRKHHQKNKHHVEEFKVQVNEQWSQYMQTFGYGTPEA